MQSAFEMEVLVGGWGYFPKGLEKVRCNCRKVVRVGGPISLGKLLAAEL